MPQDNPLKDIFGGLSELKITGQFVGEGAFIALVGAIERSRANTDDEVRKQQDQFLLDVSKDFYYEVWRPMWKALRVIQPAEGKKP